MKRAVRITLLLLTALAASAAATQPRAARAGDMFGEGTQYVPLTANDKKQLLAFVKDSKVRLRRALDDAAKKTFEDTRQIYYGAIYDVVRLSFEKNLANELLMRMVLNQGLKATLGMPRIPGVTNGLPGSLKGAQNRDVITLILKQSIELALLCAEDEEAILDTGGDGFLTGPFIEVANVRLLRADTWRRSVINPYFQRRFLFDTLSSWLAMVKRVDAAERAAYASEVLELEEIVASGHVPVLGSLRALFDRLLELNARLQSQSSPTLKKSSFETKSFQSTVDRLFVQNGLGYSGARPEYCTDRAYEGIFQLFQFKEGPACVLFPKIYTGSSTNHYEVYDDFTFETMISLSYMDSGQFNFRLLTRPFLTWNMDQPPVTDLAISFQGMRLEIDRVTRDAPEENTVDLRPPTFSYDRVFSDASDLPAKQWIHIVITRRGGILSIFRNGIRTAVSSSPVSGRITFEHIGGGEAGSAQGSLPLHGAIGMYRLSRQAIEANQVPMLYEFTRQEGARAGHTYEYVEQPEN